MKSSIADYQTRIFAVRIVSPDGSNTARFVQYPTDLKMTSNTSPVGEVDYIASSEYEFTSLSVGASMAPPVIDLRGILTDAVGQLGRLDIHARTWDNAKAYLFATSWANPVEDDEPMGTFLLGKSKIEDDTYVYELMGLIDVVNQNTGSSIGPLCRWTLFDETLDGETLPWSLSRCTGPRSSPDGPDIDTYKVTGTITTVTDNATFADTARAEADDYFGAGSIRFTSGNNAGVLSEEIKSYSASGQISVFNAFPYAVEVGDAYEMAPGCRKRRLEDCVAKYNNAVNFGGFDHVPPPSVYTQFGTGDA